MRRPLTDAEVRSLSPRYRAVNLAGPVLILLVIAGDLVSPTPDPLAWGRAPLWSPEYLARGLRGVVVGLSMALWMGPRIVPWVLAPLVAFTAASGAVPWPWAWWLVAVGLAGAALRYLWLNVRPDRGPRSLPEVSPADVGESIRPRGRPGGALVVLLGLALVALPVAVHAHLATDAARFEARAVRTTATVIEGRDVWGRPMSAWDVELDGRRISADGWRECLGKPGSPVAVLVDPENPGRVVATCAPDDPGSVLGWVTPGVLVALLGAHLWLSDLQVERLVSRPQPVRSAWLRRADEDYVLLAAPDAERGVDLGGFGWVEPVPELDAPGSAPDRDFDGDADAADDVTSDDDDDDGWDDAADQVGLDEGPAVVFGRLAPGRSIIVRTCTGRHALIGCGCCVRLRGR